MLEEGKTYLIIFEDDRDGTAQIVGNLYDQSSYVLWITEKKYGRQSNIPIEVSTILGVFESAKRDHVFIHYKCNNDHENSYSLLLPCKFKQLGSWLKNIMCFECGSEILRITAINTEG